MPKVVDDDYYEFRLRKRIGKTLFGLYNYATHFLVGWPVYILFGATGGPKYGVTNHFWPFAPFNNGEKELFPGKYKN